MTTRNPSSRSRPRSPRRSSASRSAGLPAEKVHSRGQMTIWDRIEHLVDPGTFRPLHILFNPKNNVEGTTGVVDGLAKIGGKWCVLAGFDNKVMAGAWIAGQAENQLRITDLAKRLHIPLVWLVNCSGVKLTEQEEVYADRRGNGTTFFRHAELEKTGNPHPGRHLLAPTPRAAATRALAPPTSSLTRTATSPSAAAASWAA